mgnify:CR=1 FL=1
MSRDREFLFDIIESAERAVGCMGQRALDDFIGDPQCCDAVVRRLEVVGDASRRVSEATRRSHPEAPWQEMISMRNLVIHEYDAVDLSVIWDTVRNDLPRIVPVVRQIMNALK